MRSLNLPDGSRSQLEELVGAIRDALAVAVRASGKLGADLRALAVAIDYDPDLGLLPGYVHPCSPASRDYALAEAHAGQRIVAAWVPGEWPDDEPQPLATWSPELLAMQARLSTELEGLGVVDPEIWVAEEACLQLNQRPPTGATEDFVAFPTDGMFSGHLIASLRYVTPPKTLRQLTRQRLLSSGDPYDLFD